METPQNNPAFIIDETAYETELTAKFRNRKPWQRADPNQVTAYIPGVIQKIIVQKGQRVKWGESLLILEAMKMKNDVTAPKDGIIRDIHVQEGVMVAKNTLLVTLE